MAYRGLIFDIDYFNGQDVEEVKELAQYVEEHDVKVGVVTMETKTNCDRWLRTAPLRVDHIMSKGTLKMGRANFCKKPDGLPMATCVTWLECEKEDVLSVCTKDIDKKASEAAGLDWKENPSPKEIIASLTTDPAKEVEQININVAAPRTGIFGAVCGDYIGSCYEHKSKCTRDTDFDLFGGGEHKVTDDTILTMAIADWLMGEHSDENLTDKLVSYARRYPIGTIWGDDFKRWFMGDTHEKRPAASNGCAMRVGPVGCYAETMEECLALAKQSAEMTHNSEGGIKGAQAIAACVFMVRHGKSKAEVKGFVEDKFGFDLDQNLDDIRQRNWELTHQRKPKKAKKKETDGLIALLDAVEELSRPFIGENELFDCVKTVTAAIICWLESDTYEETVRKAVSLAGDADTIAAMAGVIASNTPGMEIPEDIATKCFEKMPDFLKRTMVKFDSKYNQ